MSIQFLLDNFEQLFDSEEKIKNFDTIILQLAVSGRLNTQHPEDEPASDLLNRITAEKQALIKAGTLKPQKPLPPVAEAEHPFTLPDSWLWVRLGEVTYNLGQKNPTSTFSYIDISSIDNNKGFILDDLNILTPENAPSRARKIVSIGSVLYSTVRPYLLNIAIVDREIIPSPIASTGFAVFHTNNFLSEKYLYHYLRSNCFIRYVESKMIGVAYPAINDFNLLNGVLPLPPLEEQQRIVAKVEELLSKSAEIKEYFSEKNKMRVKLNQSLLHHLQESQNHEEFKKNFDLITSHFNGLYDNQENMKALRQTILQLAVSGRLNTQHPEDEPATTLLNRITAEKQALIKAGKLKAQKPLLPIDETEAPFQIPPSWVWARLGGVIQLSSGDFLPSYKMIANGNFPVYGGNGINGRHDSANVFKKSIVIGRVGFYCGSVHLTEGDAWVTDNAFITKYSEENIDQNFLFLLLKATDLKVNDKGTAQPVISGRKVYPLPIPLPPLNEQKRIVAKVEKLLALCEALEAQLAQQQANATALLNSLVHELVGVGSL
jgi:type I restriction enzyme S subunit